MGGERGAPYIFSYNWKGFMFAPLSYRPFRQGFSCRNAAYLQHQPTRGRPNEGLHVLLANEKRGIFKM